jgi:hypothetical protein
MSRLNSHSLSNHVRAGLVAIGLAAAMVAAAPAQAGIADAVKKAKEKAARAMGQKTEAAAPAEEGRPVFDDVVLELTNDRLTHIVATFKAAAAASAGRPELVAKSNQLSDERSAHWEKHDDAIMNVRQKRGDLETCYHDGYGEARERRGREYQEKALTDPEIREKFTRAAQEHNAAAARGDSSAIQKLNEVLMGAILPTKEDSAKVRQKCGPLPPPLPSEIRLDALDKQLAEVHEKIRKIDEKVAAAQAEQGGLDRNQFAMAVERIQMYLTWKRSQTQTKGSSASAARGFTPEEIEALEKYLEELRAALG